MLISVRRFTLITAFKQGFLPFEKNPSLGWGTRIRIEDIVHPAVVGIGPISIVDTFPVYQEVGSCNKIVCWQLL